VAGEQVADRPAVGLPDPLIEQGGGADHQQAAWGGWGIGEGLIDQQAEVAVVHRAGDSSSPTLLGQAAAPARPPAPSRRESSPQGYSVLPRSSQRGRRTLPSRGPTASDCTSVTSSRTARPP
jgi:hypothetical protein